MRSSLELALRRAGEFFMGKSPIHKAAEKLGRTLGKMNVDFAVAGAMAANAHGHVRSTEELDIVITAEGLERFKREWLGRGWVELHPGSRGLRDEENGVRIDILLTGGFPGDRKPKPVAFPDPALVATSGPGGLPVLRLETLIELKLASGMTAPHRPRDLDDVIQLIRRNGLPPEFANRLDPYVRAKYREMWEAAQIEDEY